MRDFPFPALLIYGPPGAGKGTVSKFLKGTTDAVFHLSTGDMFRELSPTSAAGALFRKYADKGLLVPDEDVVQIWKSYVLELIEKGRFSPDRQLLLLDGIPRTVEQARCLDLLITVRGIIVLDIPNQEALFDRLTKRAEIEGREDDRDLEVLRTRMSVYEKETSQVLHHYPEELQICVNADQLPLEVKRDVLVGVTSLLVNKG